MSMLEADCTRCREIFVPHGTDPVDLIHGETYAGKECGGIGIILGAWLTAGGKPPPKELYDSLNEMETHALEVPHCRDLDCQWHFPKPPLEYHSNSC